MAASAALGACYARSRPVQLLCKAYRRVWSWVQWGYSGGARCWVGQCSCWNKASRFDWCPEHTFPSPFYCQGYDNEPQEQELSKQRRGALHKSALGAFPRDDGLRKGPTRGPCLAAYLGPTILTVAVRCSMQAGSPWIAWVPSFVVLHNNAFKLRAHLICGNSPWSMLNVRF